MKTIALRGSGRSLMAVLTSLLAVVISVSPVFAQHSRMAATTNGSKLPGSVLLFPPTINDAKGGPAELTPRIKEAQQIIGEALARFLNKGGLGVVPYRGVQSPSVVRALQETQGLKPEEASKGPFDDPRIAKRLAEVMNAQEYITATVDNYQYDSTTRRATFNLSVTRNASNGTALGSFAQKAVGEAPGEVSLSMAEGSATARGADFVAEQAVKTLYPDSAAILNPPPPVKTERKKSPWAWAIPAAAVLGLLIIPR
jgi:hypothetical protein